MTLESIIETPAAAGAIIRARRTARGLSQQTLAETAGVSRKFLIDLEAGHDRAELGKTLAVMAALGLTLSATDPLPRGKDFDPARRDYAKTFTELLAERDFEFAIKMLADYATASLATGRPLLQRSPRLKDPHWSAALAGITNYTAHRLGQPAPPWTRRIKPLDSAWMPAQSYRTIREPMKKLTMSQTPKELAALNVFIRERSLATAWPVENSPPHKSGPSSPNSADACRPPAPTATSDSSAAPHSSSKTSETAPPPTSTPATPTPPPSTP